MIMPDFNKMTLRQINRHFRAIDESHLWPIRGTFNVTERAIRQARAFDTAGAEYAALLDYLIGLIVNDERNW